MQQTKPIIQTYLSFNGRCDEALEFYKSTLDAEVVMLLRFKDNPEPTPPGCPPSPPEKVMHSQFRVGDTVVMASDGRCTGELDFGGFSLALGVPDEATADRYFNALAEGGKVMMPLANTFFSPRFGMVEDKFGIGWMVLVSQAS